nr:hypothetical protein [Pseudopedobacter sp.]
MAIVDINSDVQKNDLIYLIRRVKALQTDLGAYIEHFHYSDDIIIVKLTNGFIKINESLLLKHQVGQDEVTQKELLKIGNTFIKTLL